MTSIRKLRNFIGDIAGIVETQANEATLLERGAQALRELIELDDWLPDAYARPSAERYQQYLLYADAQQRFSVVSFVWGPGQSTPVHNHTVWGLLGVLRGAEYATPYAPHDSGTLQQSGPEILLPRGTVESVSPSTGDIHRVRNAYGDRVSISIHVYGANIGAIRRSVWPESGSSRPFISGYSNDLLPNLWDLSKEPSL